MPDMLFILVLALVIFGPAKLPELARQLGKYKAQFKQMQRALTEQLESEMRNIEATQPGQAPTQATAPGDATLATLRAVEGHGFSPAEKPAVDLGP